MDIKKIYQLPKQVDNLNKDMDKIKNIDIPEINSSIGDIQTNLCNANTNIDAKADITYVNTLTQSIASGSPKPFASLSAIQTAFPKGDSNNYVSLADGNLYYWNGSAWIIGWKYLPTEIQNESITYDKFAHTVDELLIRTGYIENLYFESGAVDSTGTFVSNTTRMRTQMAFYKAGTVFTILNTQYSMNIAIYGLNKTFVSMTGYLNNYTLNMDCYIIIVVKNSSGTAISNIPAGVLSVAGDKYKGLLDEIDEIKTTLNIKPPEIDYWEQGAISANGTESVNTTRIRSSYVYLNTGTTIKVSSSYYISSDYYGNDKIFVSQTTYSSSVKILKAGYYRFVVRYIDNRVITGISKNDYTISIGAVSKKNIPQNSNYIHFSFDDVSFCFQNLIANKSTFTSIFNDPFFSKLRDLHEGYGARFSLYCYGTTLSGLDGTFKQDFIDNSDWLKFGLHSWTYDNYINTTVEQAKSDWDNFINRIFTITGGLNSIDRIPRLHMFAGNLDSLKAMRDTNCGALGFLSADDNRNTYYLNDNQKNHLLTHDKLYDMTNGLVFYSTDMRLDWFTEGFSSDNIYNTPVKNNPYDELIYRYGMPSMADCYSSLIVFTHEWQAYYQSYAINPVMFNMIEQVCQFANDYGFTFDYPQNRVNGGITSVIVS